MTRRNTTNPGEYLKEALKKRNLSVYEICKHGDIKSSTGIYRYMEGLTTIEVRTLIAVINIINEMRPEEPVDANELLPY